eukprot:TRINITY_DN3391_c0_g1_i3.p1 TRINITY_DN3391_c0_g1~~TRINITY_DN3391_c0_g1_i3.p1  ORF type:complete len:351 (+),score=96.89 TRINITY_DN3391_c0_g1_i3:86-1138(+)
MKCSTCCALLAVFVAAAVGLAPLALQYADGFDGPLKGFVPLSHRGKPFGFTFEQMPDLSGKVAVVTGANIGLGYWTALHLARKGARTVLACRSTEKCAAAVQQIRANHSGAAVTGMMLDLNSLKSVRSFAKAFLAEFDRLDSLVLNAGVFVPPYSLSADGLETQFAVNHVAHQLLAQLLQERLVASAPSTVVVLSSNLHYSIKAKDIPLTKEAVNDPSVGRYQCYARSKAANVLFAQELSARISARGVRVNAVHPGVVHTAAGRHIKNDAAATLGDSLQPFWDWVDSKLWDAETASLTQLYAAVSPEIAERNITGKYFHPIARVTEPDPATADAALQRRLWDFTEALCAE